MKGGLKEMTLGNELVSHPSGHNAIEVKWAYKIKRNAKGVMERYKTRLVVKGYGK